MKLCAAHIDEATILDYVRNAPAPNFDLPVDSLIALKQTCGDSSSKYAAAMRAKMAGNESARSKTPVKPKPRVPKPAGGAK